MKLYYAPGASSLAPHILLREAGLSFEMEKVDLSDKRTAAGEDYGTVSPKGYVPVLRLDDGSVLTEIPAILQYLADLVPDAQLAPPSGSFERYRLQEWLNFIATELHKQFAPLFNPKSTDKARAAATETIRRRCNYIEDALRERDYLMGGYSAADAYLYAILGWCGVHKIPMDRWPRLQAFLAKVAQRPAVQAALKAEGLLR